MTDQDHDNEDALRLASHRAVFAKRRDAATVVINIDWMSGARISGDVIPIKEEEGASTTFTSGSTK
jgi:hypothetical protein